MSTPGKVFLRAYWGLIGLVVIIEVVAFVAGLTTPDANSSPIQNARFMAVLFLIFPGTLLLAVLLLLSVWGLIRYRRYRLWFGLTAAVLIVWLPYAIHLFLTTPLP